MQRLVGNCLISQSYCCKTAVLLEKREKLGWFGNNFNSHLFQSKTLILIWTAPMINRCRKACRSSLFSIICENDQTLKPKHRNSIFFSQNVWMSELLSSSGLRLCIAVTSTILAFGSGLLNRRLSSLLKSLGRGSVFSCNVVLVRFGPFENTGGRWLPSQQTEESHRLQTGLEGTTSLLQHILPLAPL